MFRIKRAYAPPGPEDGCRVLVDRLWPRGLSKQAASVDVWVKEIAPSTELRKWFGHDPERWPEFQRRYREELKTAERTAALEQLRDLERENRVVTLLFGAREEAYNHAVMLQEILNA